MTYKFELIDGYNNVICEAESYNIVNGRARVTFPCTDKLAIPTHVRFNGSHFMAFDKPKTLAIGDSLTVDLYLPPDASHMVIIDYTNWHGERRTREIYPLNEIRFGTTEWHPNPQWLIKAIDCEDGRTKEFAMKDIHNWESK